MISTTKLLEIQNQAKYKTKQFVDTVNHSLPHSVVLESYKMEIKELNVKFLKSLEESAISMSEMQSSQIKKQTDHDKRIQHAKNAQIVTVDSYTETIKQMKSEMKQLENENKRLSKMCFNQSETIERLKQQD